MSQPSIVSPILKQLQKAIFLVLLVCLIGCKSGRSPTAVGDGPLLPDFGCEETAKCSLTCTDRTTGGERPYLLLWQADEQAPTSVINPTFSWSFDSTQLVRVRLIVTDENGEGETEGPVERAFEICRAESSTSTLGSEADFDAGSGPS